MKNTGPVLVAVAVFALWLLNLVGVIYYFPSWEQRAQFGDLFGSVTALFSGLAFAGLVYAILLQRQDLSLQRDELTLQREEMKASREEFTAQAKAQQALVKATIAQIRVAAHQARIGAVTLAASNPSDMGSRAPSADKIHEIASSIDSLAQELERCSTTDT